ncbi:hypothetical protein L0Z72_02585 [candidate division KSB1 bacterium]|nr:hypothetical protein [candidate division KSB1 bacterium]
MLRNSFLNERHKFYIVKSCEKTENADLVNDYRRVLKVSTIVALFSIMAMFHYFPRLADKNTNMKMLSVSIEVIDIPNIKEEEPPPPPPPVQEMVQIINIIEKKEELDPRRLREELETVELDLNMETENNLLASSQIDNISYAGFAGRLSRSQKGASLNIASELNLSHQSGAGLDLNMGEKAARKKFVDNSPSLDNSVLPPPKEQRSENNAATANTDLIKVDKNQFLLKESESTIGTDEYRLWNKINAALDRLDKNRYGKLPENVQRTSGGLTCSFRYSDGIIHDIFWNKGGKVIIRVTGSRSLQISNELGKAFDAVLRLTL